MKFQSHQNKKIFHAPVTRQNYFAGLEPVERVVSCCGAIEGEILQFMNETSILLEMARQGFTDNLVYDVENETGVCLDLASFDMDVKSLALKYKKMLKKHDGLNVL